MPTIVRQGDIHEANNAALAKTLMKKPPILLNAPSRLVGEEWPFFQAAPEEGCQQQFRIMQCLYRINVLD